jgi:hypothetical protein
MYQKIYDFCKVKNKGTCYKNGANPSPRVQYIIKLCEELGISYEIDVWAKESNDIEEYTILDFPSLYPLLDPDKLDFLNKVYHAFNREARRILAEKGINSYPEELTADEMDLLGEEYWDVFDKYDKQMHNIIGDIKAGQNVNNFYNIMLMGNSDKFVVAHHDIVNPESDNANDNSCSVINAISIKMLRPDVNVVILDGEETGGIGSTRLSERIKSGEFDCKWILNLELTGRGGKNFFVGAMGTPLTDSIANLFQCPVVKVPFNDSLIFKRHGINSTVINPLPIVEKETPIMNKEGKYLDMSLLFNCHRTSDSLDTISTEDMKEFVNEICLKIIDEL